MAEKNNAPMDWTPAGAAVKSTEDFTTFAEDMRFSASAFGAGELFEGLSTPSQLLGVVGVAMAGIGWLLMLGIVL